MEIKKTSILLLIILIFLIGKYSFKEVIDVFTYIGRGIYPSHPQIGILLIFLFFVTLLFFKEIKQFSGRIRLK